jgi:hypothetical protein
VSARVREARDFSHDTSQGSAERWMVRGACWVSSSAELERHHGGIGSCVSWFDSSRVEKSIDVGTSVPEECSDTRNAYMRLRRYLR